ncbi:hypothetical protein I8752_06155 [Nostocaceae cyanobacterium CENA369]|uniref:Uncharacterized protein n=1 Tax=Dendronalium phyllosphericum CENA369 TaxID=1725256 RepID=A0A8J7I441_9NOST|nr:hypothetical protein [Dendronalium phyllosphericum]MBH8572601.1 hypothetical protein [Dendronalium phyllosphericum CENA369]
MIVTLTILQSEFSLNSNYLDRFLAISNDKPLLCEKDFVERLYANVLQKFAIAAVFVLTVI